MSVLMNHTPEPFPSPSPSRRSTLTLGLLGLAGGILSLGLSPSASEADEAGKKTPVSKPIKIVLHVSDADGWAAAFSNLKNLTSQYPTVKLRVIVDGSGIYMMQGVTDMSAQFQKYSSIGVEFQACNNALKEKQILPSALPGFVQVIPAAVIAIAESQYSGYAYIKP
jgi:uncharacterized protein